MVRMLVVLCMVLTACGKVEFESANSVNRNSCVGSDCDSDPTPNPIPDPVPRDVRETYTTPTTNQVDILFVIDNSPSMEVEQNAISTRLNDFTNLLTDLDWRIAITSTSMSGSSNPRNGFLLDMTATQKYLTPATPNFASIFETKVKLGSSGSGAEQGINATLTAIERQEVNWLRPNAQLAVIVLSDEDEYSNQNNSGWTQRNEASYLVERTHQVLGSQKNFSFHSIVISDEACRVLQNNQLDSNGVRIPAYMGEMYMEASDRTGGIVGDICSTNYTNELSTIGNRIDQFIDSVPLQCQPYNNVITVRKSDGSAIAGRIDGPRFLFNTPVGGGITLTVSYQCI